MGTFPWKHRIGMASSMKKRQDTTIIDIARLAGVSKSTVSRVLTDAPNISKDARERVLEVVRQTGFRPNHLARSLRSGNTGIVGLVIPDIANPFWADVARGAQDAASDKGTSILIFSSDWDPDREARHFRALLQARVDGAIINPVRDSLEDIADFGIPLVLIGSSAGRFADLPSVGSNIEQGVAIGLDHANTLGLGLPALIVGDAERSARLRFVAAVKAEISLRGSATDNLIVEDGHYTVEGGRAAMERILASSSKPTFIFAANDLMALGAMQAVREAGLRCPEDISILGFDGIPAGEVSAPGLTTVAKPSRQLGAHAFNLLTEKRQTAEHLTLPCTLIERGSVRTAPPLSCAI
ncbi:LacI family DNA-binding transcriptional regulator [Flavimaricola marinus]|uniref:HTH-type transcriptional regulator DegA n=1 Tax=Flavimaricola marinus TaxID=1819565 RepID=A0A238LM11_9RHOB|nr:LacI family DNA-binding transcriptional regulator [Flavimaricola marinus]SMY09986.1 HTH-type transcriptional regulator DegA [Flavimaricola marinus]